MGAPKALRAHELSREVETGFVYFHKKNQISIKSDRMGYLAASVVLGGLPNQLVTLVRIGSVLQRLTQIVKVTENHHF